MSDRRELVSPPPALRPRLLRLRVPGRRPRHGEAGYNLVILTVAITVMTILVAAVLPLWSQEIKRDKEEELRFRGLQYAEAIRVFQARFGRFPVRLEELIEVKPRSIRQLWKDPMTESGKWGLVFAGVGIGVPNAGQQVPPQPGDGGIDDGRGGEEGDDKTVTIGPIMGVFSRSDDDSIATFMGQKTYRRWTFTVDLLQGGGARSVTTGVAPQQPVNPGLPVLTRMEWIGRPFRPFLESGGAVSGAGPNRPVGAGGNSPRGGKPQSGAKADAAGRQPS
jgi:type II secretory pathway pseudopilin PulG